MIFDRTLPFTCRTISTSLSDELSPRRTTARARRQAFRMAEPLPELLGKVRSERREDAGRTARASAGGGASVFVTSLTKIIICAMAVLNRSASISSPTFLTVAW